MRRLMIDKHYDAVYPCLVLCFIPFVVSRRADSRGRNAERFRVPEEWGALAGVCGQLTWKDLLPVTRRSFRYRQLLGRDKPMTVRVIYNRCSASPICRLGAQSEVRMQASFKFPYT